MTDRMAAVDHTHPAQDAVTGAYRRGRGAGDGLRADGSGEEPEADADSDPETDSMRDVSHTPVDGDGTNGVWARGEREYDDE
jgi:hypothetical protein